MQGKRTGWWAATAVLAIAVIATGVVRANQDSGGGDAYEAGELIGATLGALLIPALIAFLVVRFGKVDGYWALPAVLAAAVVLNVVVALANQGETLTACEGAPVLQSESLVAGAPYEARPLSAAQARQIDSSFQVDGAETDTTRVVDTRDGATYVLAAATSTGEEVRPVDVFAGFTDAAGAGVEETEIGGLPARIARGDGFVRMITATGCSAVTLIGAGERPTRALADRLRF